MLPSLFLTCLLGGALTAAEPPASAPSHPRGYLCLRASEPIVVDGKMDDASWKNAEWTDHFVDIEGALKPLPRFKTRAKMLWDNQYFYIATEMEEPHVWGTLEKHDSVIFHDNDFEVFIDPDGDNHEYYEFEMNALNTGWDLFLKQPYRDGGPAENAWEIPGLKTGVHVQGTLNNSKDSDQGWSVEIAIPWSVLKEYAHRDSPPKTGDQWRVNFSRVEWKHEIKDGKYVKVPNTKEDNWVWSPQGVIDMHRPELWGYVQFSNLTESSPKVGFRPDPSWSARCDLMRVYHAQREHQAKNKAFADSLEALGLKDLSTRVKLEKNPAGFQATINFGSNQRIRIEQNSRFFLDQ